jgi:hypothetical protein
MKEHVLTFFCPIIFILWFLLVHTKLHDAAIGYNSFTVHTLSSLRTHVQNLPLGASSKTEPTNPQDWQSHHRRLTVDGDVAYHRKQKPLLEKCSFVPFHNPHLYQLSNWYKFFGTNEWSTFVPARIPGTNVFPVATVQFSCHRPSTSVSPLPHYLLSFLCSHFLFFLFSLSGFSTVGQ